MEQRARIEKMERFLDEGIAAVSELSKALEQYQAALAGIKELEAYYESEAWANDLQDDCSGKLPADLKRGVLSEDGIWNLLTDHDRLMEILKTLSA